MTTRESTTAEPDPGDVVGDRYELQEQVGRGGFGVVWRATDRTTGQDVALKHPNFRGAASDELVERYFDREMDVLEDIAEAGGHPNVMGYHDRERAFGMPFVVVEYVPGKEIGDLVMGDDPVDDPDEARTIAVGICDALSYLHDNDIIYRDLKPDNIIVGADREPKIIDFTTAKGFVPEQGAPDFTSGDGGSSDDSTVPGEFKPPELNEGASQRQGPWSDVYSVGKLLCFMLVGWVPDDDEVSPGDFGVDSPTYLDEIIATATKHDTGERYPNASVLRRALEDRDPAMPEQATLTWLGRDKHWTVSPGDSIGRDHPEGPRPSIILDDDTHRALSAVHCRFDTDEDGNWEVVDKSLNGTYISKHDRQDWQLLLSEAGKHRREARGEAIHGDPASRATLEDGDTIALVEPNYPEKFYFQFSNDQ